MDMIKAERCAEFVRTITDDFVPEIGIILGSGMGSIFNGADIKYTVDYADIPEFPKSTAEGHRGRFLFMEYEGKNIVVMQGRVHYYEGYSIQETVLPVCVMKLLGIETLMLTNAAGGISQNLDAGDIMIITDHISMFVPSPLTGKNDDRYGERFPDMSCVYNVYLTETLKNVFLKNNLPVKTGTYVQTSGPNYETPSEIKMLRALGCDAVGMSTVCEAMTAHYLGIKVCGISLITNKAAGLGNIPLSHSEVQKIADIISDKISVLIDSFIKTQTKKP